MSRGRGQGLEEIGQSVTSLRVPVPGAGENTKLIYVRDRAGLDECINKLARHKMIALDIETASVHGYGVENGVIRTIQLGVHTGNWHKYMYVIDRRHVNDEKDVKQILDLLRDPSKEFVIHNGDYEQLWFDYHHETRIANILDTKILAMHVRRAIAKAKKIKPSALHDLNLASVAQYYSDEELDKTEQGGLWSREQLTPEQVIYAGKDVDIPLAVVRKLITLAKQYDVLEEVYEDCKKIYARTHRTVLNLKGEGDDYYIAKNLLEYAQSVTELDDIWKSFDAIPIYHKNRRKLKHLYRIRKSALSQ